MVVVKTLIKNQAQLGMEPADIFSAVNVKLCENNDTNMFATAFIGIYDIQKSTMLCVNAGHNYPLIAGHNGEYRYLKPAKGQYALGIMPEAKYCQDELPLPAGATLILYTDGVTETFNRENRQYSEERLLKLVNSPAAAGKGLQGMIDSMESDVKLFADGTEQSDDITILVFRTFA